MSDQQRPQPDSFTQNEQTSSPALWTVFLGTALLG